MEKLADCHQVLKAFVERRGKHPEGTEVTQLPCSTQVVYNLYAGRYRGLTWWDEPDDVIWLLCGKWHEEGSRDDAYVLFQQLDRADRLLPDEEDVRRLIQWRRQQGVFDFSDLVAEVIAHSTDAALSSAAPTDEVARRAFAIPLALAAHHGVPKVWHQSTAEQ